MKLMLEISLMALKSWRYMSKLSFEKIKFDKPLDNSLDLSDLLLNIFSKGFDGALNEFIRQVSEECNISMKCAEYYVQKYFNFK